MRGSLLTILGAPIGLLLLYAAYSFEFDASILFSALGSFVFWVSVLLFIAEGPLRTCFKMFFRYIRSLKGAAVFAGYISVHLLFYGLLLERLLASFFDYPAYASRAAIYFTSSTPYPLTLWNVLVSLGFNPSLNVVLPPVYSLVIPLYGFVVALLIAVLVTSNIMRVAEMGRVCGSLRKGSVFIGIPLIGVVSGASCCISIPILLSIAIPLAGALASSLSAAYAAYFLFPPATAVALKVNLDFSNKVAQKVYHFV
jgi:hypothetical protein